MLQSTPCPERCAAALQWLACVLGRGCTALLVVMVIVQTAVVGLRYGFDLGSIALQESVMYLHATVFMLGAAVTLASDGHVRVDIIHRKLRESTRARLNLAGNLLFLLPTCLTILFTSVEYVLQSWEIRESSPDTGGIPGVFLLKSLIPLFAITLLMQGGADSIRQWQLARQPVMRRGRG